MKQYIKTKGGIVEFTPVFVGNVQVTSIDGEVTNKVAYDEQEQLKAKAKEKAEAERIALNNTPAKITERLTQAVQSYIDAPAIKLRYASTNSMISYLNSTVEQFVKEAKAGVAFRDACWVKAREIETDVMAGKRKPPNAEELLKELPAWKL